MRYRSWRSYAPTGATNDPCISMVANDDRLVGVGAVDDTNGVPDGSVDFFHHVLHIQNDTWSRTTAVRGPRDGANIASAVDFSTRHTMAFQGCKEWQSIFLRDRNGRNPWQDIGHVCAWRVFSRRITRGRRVSRISRKELHTASLHLRWIACTAVRIDFVSILNCHVSVLCRVGVDDACNHAIILSILNFQATEDASIYRYDQSLGVNDITEDCRDRAIRRTEMRR